MIEATIFQTIREELVREFGDPAVAGMAFGVQTEVTQSPTFGTQTEYCFTFDEIDSKPEPAYAVPTIRDKSAAGLLDQVRAKVFTALRKDPHYADLAAHVKSGFDPVLMGC